MKSPGAETSAAKSRSRRLSPPASEPKTSPDDYSLQWVTARLPPALVREIEAHAKSGGTTRSDAIRECLTLGLETIRVRDGVPGGRVEEVLGAIESVRLAVELLGPSMLGTAKLLILKSQKWCRRRDSNASGVLSQRKLLELQKRQKRQTI